jgi:hypothetical protein
MELSLGQRQRLFTTLVAKLIVKAGELGFELTFGDAYRDPRVHGPVGTKLGYGNPNSNHKNRLAVDFNLFKGGVFLQTSVDHKPLGEFWESLHPLCKWGGRFNDGNHYSLEFNGMK